MTTTSNSFEETFGFQLPSEEERQKFGKIFEQVVQTICEKKRAEFLSAARKARQTLGIPEEKEQEFFKIVNDLDRQGKEVQELEDLARQSGFNP